MIFASLAVIGGVLEAEVTAAPAAPTEIVMDANQTIMLDEIRAICARRDAEVISASTDPSTGTSLHLALVDNQGNFLADGTIAVAGRKLLRPETRLRCRGDWLMMKVQPGEYVIKAELGGHSESRTVDVPRYGRVRVAMNMGATPNS
jgi:hypothetical protein